MKHGFEEGARSEIGLGDWERRKEFSGFTKEDAELLRQLRPNAEAFVDDVVDDLYRRLLNFEETKAFLTNPTVLARVKAAQRDYFLALTDGEYGEVYLANRLLVGRTHQRINLPPAWYMGTYSIYVELVFPRIMEAVKPAAKAQRTFSALLKLISLDTEIAISTYIAAREEVISRQTHELVEAERTIYESERFTILGEMAGTMAHEIAQPLQVVSFACSAVAEEFDRARKSGQPIDDEFIQGKLARIGQQMERATRIVGDLNAFIHDSAGEPAVPFDPVLAVTAAIDLTEYSVRQAGGRITASVPSGVPNVVGHVEKLEQVLVNLITNARDAGAPTIEINVHSFQKMDGDFVRIAVNDNGSGIPPHVLPRLFESFITTKPRGKGTGLGLRTCRRIVEEMHGTISLANRAESGACFEILLPAASAN